MRYNKTIRILHLMLMLGVLAQLCSELLMQVPKPGESIDQMAGFFFSIHQLIGFVVLIIAITYLMVIMEHSKHKNRLFPWLDATLRAELIREIQRDIPGWFRGVLPSPDQAHLLAGTVHGLGLILATGLGLSGSVIYLGINSDGSMPPPIHTIKELHEILGTLMWIFMAGHLVMALLHQVKGHQVLQKIFTADGRNRGS